MRDLFTVLLGAVIFAFVLARIFPEKTNQVIISPLASSISYANEQLSNVFGGGELRKIVEASLSGTRGTYGIVIKNLRTGETYKQDENRKFDAASLYKLWVAATAFRQISEGKLSEDDTMSKDVAELNRIFHIDEEVAEATEGAITQTVNQALTQMITISHNYSALLLTQEVGASRVSSYIKELGLNDSKLGEPPTTTPSDIARFYELLYDGKITNPEYSGKMIDLLSKQALNNMMPKYLPASVRVVHKTGELDAFKHDAGIMFGRDPILFVVLSESNSQAGAAERIALLSRDTFSYFEGK